MSSYLFIRGWVGWDGVVGEGSHPDAASRIANVWVGPGPMAPYIPISELNIRVKQLLISDISWVDSRCP